MRIGLCKWANDPALVLKNSFELDLQEIGRVTCLVSYEIHTCPSVFSFLCCIKIT